MRILLIEDDQDVAALIINGLTEAGHQAEHCDNARDGLFKAAVPGYDAIILDRTLPNNIDGLRILETLRAEDNVTPILILSARNQVNDKIKGLKCGCDDYLAKPFAFSELLARLEALTRRTKFDHRELTAAGHS